MPNDPCKIWEYSVQIINTRCCGCVAIGMALIMPRTKQSYIVLLGLLARTHTTSCVAKLCVYLLPFSRRMASYLSKVAISFLGARPEVTPLVHEELCRQKSEVRGLSCDVICVMIYLAVLIQHRLVTHRHTDTSRAIADTALAHRHLVQKLKK